MARKSTRRVTRGGFSLPSWVPFFGKPSCESAKKKSAAATEAADAAKKVESEVCPGESSAASTPTETPVTDTTSTPPVLGRGRRRQTRRKTRGGKHRRGH